MNSLVSKEKIVHLFKEENWHFVVNLNGFWIRPKNDTFHLFLWHSSAPSFSVCKIPVTITCSNMTSGEANVEIEALDSNEQTWVYDVLYFFCLLFIIFEIFNCLMRWFSRRTMLSVSFTVSSKMFVSKNWESFRPYLMCCMLWMNFTDETMNNISMIDG